MPDYSIPFHTQIIPFPASIVETVRDISTLKSAFGNHKAIFSEIRHDLKKCQIYMKSVPTSHLGKAAHHRPPCQAWSKNGEIHKCYVQVYGKKPNLVKKENIYKVGDLLVRLDSCPKECKCAGRAPSKVQRSGLLHQILRVPVVSGKAQWKRQFLIHFPITLVFIHFQITFV